MEMDVIVWEWMSGFDVEIYNPSTQSQSIKLDFALQTQTTDGRTSCDMFTKDEIGANLIWNMGQFVVSPNSSSRRRVDFNFPVCTNQTFDLCAVQLAPSAQNLWSFDVFEWKVSFFTLNVSPSTSCTPFVVKAFPGSRSSENFSNIWEIRFYSANDLELKYSDMFEINEFGSWLLQDSVPSGKYYVVYKWQSHLASYLSGVDIVQWWELFLDFTTWANLHNTQNKSITQNDGHQYQIAWDLKNIEWHYDFMINGNDIAILTADWFEDSGVSVLDPKNLNGDWAINVSDISIIGINFELTDPFLWSELFVW